MICVYKRIPSRRGQFVMQCEVRDGEEYEIVGETYYRWKIMGDKCYSQGSNGTWHLKPPYHKREEYKNSKVRIL